MTFMFRIPDWYELKILQIKEEELVGVLKSCELKK